MDNASTTAEGLDIIKRANATLDGVTPGPWMRNSIGEVGPVSADDDQSFGMICHPVCECVWPNKTDNSRFIAASRQMVPELVEALKAERDRAEKAEAMAEKLAEALRCWTVEEEGKGRSGTISAYSALAEWDATQ